MPTILKCSQCGHVLKRWEKAPSNYAVPYYYDVFNELNGKCPNCGHKLPDPDVFPKVMKVEVTEALE